MRDSEADLFSRAHPRAYGENADYTDLIDMVEGSSPRIRGKLLLEALVQAGVGLIPAHTGKTSTVNQSRRRRWAHPRAYGENAKNGGAFKPGLGSSPRIRGKRREVARVVARPGLIPAHTGKTRRTAVY